MYNKILNSYLKSAGNRIGEKLFLDSNGLCVLKKKEPVQEYVIELPNKSQIVYFYAPVCRVPFGCSEEFFEKVLELNLCGIEYNQATFGLDSKTQNIVISYTRSMESLDEISFINIFCNFIKTVDRAKKNLEKLSQSLEDQYRLTSEDIDTEMTVNHPKFGFNKLKA